MTFVADYISGRKVEETFVYRSIIIKSKFPVRYGLDINITVEINCGWKGGSCIGPKRLSTCLGGYILIGLVMCPAKSQLVSFYMNPCVQMVGDSLYFSLKRRVSWSYHDRIYPPFSQTKLYKRKSILISFHFRKLCAFSV